MIQTVNNAYQQVADYAASSPYPVAVPANFDKTAAIKAIRKAIEVCEESETQVHNIAEVIRKYSEGDWSISSNTFSQIGDFIGFVIKPTRSIDDAGSRFKFL